jgi:selenocysteine lyase/cysteine desulfurase
LGAALDYIASLGREFGADYVNAFPGLSGRQLDMRTGMAAVGAYEQDLAAHLIEMIGRIPGSHIAGVTDPSRCDERVPTVVFTLEGHTPREIAERLAHEHIYVWDGNYYAVEIMERLGHGEHGMVRVGLAHYNTHEEIDRLEAALRKM